MPHSRGPCMASTAPTPFSAISLMASRTEASGDTAKTSGVLDPSNWRTVRMAVSLEGSGRILLRQGYSCRPRMPRIHQVQRPLLGFLVQPAQVLADQAQRHQLHAA